MGSFAVEGLVRSGVGHLTLVDHDEVCVTNTNRQLHATAKTVHSDTAPAILELSLARAADDGREGVLGDEDSSRDDSFSSGNRLLEHSQYTRPREYRGHEVPEVLLSGDHPQIAAWRKQNSIERTRHRRPDLLSE